MPRILRTARAALATVAVPAAVFSCAPAGPERPPPVLPSTAASPVTLLEASGVVRHGSELLIVSDDDPGSIYRFTLPDPPSGDPWTTVTLDPLRRSHWPLATVALDLESIDVLADGRIVLLSEQLTALVAETGVVAAYPGLLSKFGERGVEGLAVRRLPDNRSRVAVLWEGGYPRLGSVPAELRSRFGTTPMSPVVWVHDLEPGSLGLSIGKKNLLRAFPLEIPKPGGVEPLVQRFRSPDLVWHRIRTAAGDEWGFIAILSSQNSVERPHYAHHWLQRFGGDGRRIGDPVDLDAMLPADLQGKNWEGLSWLVEGESLVVIYEHDPRTEQPRALIMSLPTRWRP